MSSKGTKRLQRLLNRPWYLPRPTKDEIVGASLAKLHEDLTRILTPKATTHEQ